MSYKARVRSLRGARWASAIAFLQIASAVANGAPAADGNPEDFRVELTGAAWLVDTRGTIQASGTPIDLVSDLGAEQRQPTFYGRLVFKPGRKHRIVVEGTPFRVTGNNTVNRTIVYRGQTFTVNQTLRSSADVNYVFAGYQYDVLSGPLGHLGFSAGGAYLGATGSIMAVETATNAAKTETVGLPLAGAEGRIFPIRGHKVLTFEGGVRGMSVGAYGHYFEATGSGGVSLGPITMLAGYRTVTADIHSSSSTNPEGVNARFRGPIFSLEWRR